MNTTNNCHNLNKEFMLKKRRKSIRKIIVYNIINSIVDYIVYQYNNILHRNNKIAPEVLKEYDSIYQITDIINL